MNRDDYPTPETDAVIQSAKSISELLGHARNLERRLRLCQDTLRFYAADTEDDNGRTAEEALAATEQRP